MTTPKLPRTINRRIHSIINPRSAFGGEEFRLGLRGDGAVVQIRQNGRWTDYRITTRAAYDEVANRWADPYDRNPALIAFCGRSEND